MLHIDKYDIHDMAENAFEMILEGIEDLGDYQHYIDMTSKQQRDFILLLKMELNKICDDELENIEKNWSNDSSEIRQLKNRIKELERQVESMKYNDWSEDMGK